MIASIIWDAFAGLGCMTFTVLLMAAGAFAIALRFGLLPCVADALRKLGKEKPDG